MNELEKIIGEETPREEDKQIIEEPITQPPPTEVYLLTVTENGYGAKTLFDGFKMLKRTAGGSKAVKTDTTTGQIVSAQLVSDDGLMLIITRKGKCLILAVTEISKATHKGGKGIKLITLDKGDKVAQTIGVR